METIYLINKIWFDSMENDPGRAVGYNPVGYVETEEEAKSIFASGKLYGRKDCWALSEANNTPEFTYTPIHRIRIK